MRAEPSSYAVLGLEPGADPAAIERAYKKLIKRHHPDRAGGDARRAAEINRAYRELRGRQSLAEPLLIEDEQPARGGNGWVRAAVAVTVVLAALLLASGPVTAWVSALTNQTSRPVLGRLSPSAETGDAMDRPLDGGALDKAVREALRMYRKGDEAALLRSSRECHRALRLSPTVGQLDRCAAFDDAVVELQNKDPSWDGGPFSQPAVTRRQWAAASALSNDYLAVDGRLNRIRLAVELALAPREPPPTAAPVIAARTDAASD